MADLIPWMQALVARIPSEPESIIQDELVQVVKDFCREGNPWRMRLDGYDVVAGQATVTIPTVDIDVDQQADCLNIFKVFYKKQELGHAPYRLQTHTDGSPIGFTCPFPGIVTLIPPPAASETGVLDVYASLVPADPVTWVPDFFASHHYEAILDGALGRFYNQPMKPFHDRELAKYHLRRYRNKTREASDMAGRGYTPAAADWSYPRFGV